MKTLPHEEFLQKRRDLLLSYEVYSKAVQIGDETISLISQGLAQPADKLAAVPIGNLVSGTKERATTSLDLLAQLYSAGLELTELRAFFPQVLRFWKDMRTSRGDMGRQAKGR